MNSRVLIGLLGLTLLSPAPQASGSRANPAGPSVQDGCRAPAPAASSQPNIFTAAQEADLGDAVAERIEPALRVIEDDAINAHLRQIGEQLVSHLPQNGLRISFSLIDLPEANALVLPGGRVFVTRKLVGFTQTEDELASVLGHELGHLVARQQSVQLTKQLAEVVGVNEVGDRQDIFEKYNRMMDNAARKPGAFKSASHTDKDQLEADRLGVFVVAAAGYDPQAHVGLFDRFAHTEGNTGSFLSALFGTTSPDARRLGELIKSTAALPASCSRPFAHDPAAYREWQRQVISFAGPGRKESLQGVLARTPLTPPLRGEVTHLRFSPDGRHLLAQDDAGIIVLSRDPMAVEFRIAAADAEPAHFTPDSSAVVFHTPDLRVERWSLATRKPDDVRDIARRDACITSELSPDGRILACMDGSFGLWILDVATGEPVFQKKALTTSQFVSDAPLAFSPDGRYVVAGYRGFVITRGSDEGAFVYDLRDRKPVNLKWETGRLLSASFAFLAPDRVVGLNPEEPAKSAIVTFPGGQVVERLELSRSAIAAASRGHHVLLRPFQKYAVGVLDLSSKLVVKGNALAAFDLYDDVFATERGTGDIGLYAVDGNRVLASVTLPDSAFGRIRAASISADLKWLAVSESTRGGVWDLGGGTRAVQMRGFRGAAFDSAGALLADMPKDGTTPRSIVRLDPANRQLGDEGEIKDRLAVQSGRWLISERPIPANARTPTGAEFEVRDVTRSMRLWTRSFPKDPPDVWVNAGSDSIVFGWPANSTPGRDRIREDEALRTRTDLRDLDGDYLFDVLEAERGIVRGRLLIETGKGSFRARDVLAAGDWVIVSDSLGRVLVYSLATGELKGYAFGGRPVVNLAAGLMAVDVGGGRVVVYELASMRRRREYTFTHEAALTAFSADGSRLFVLTADQIAYVLDLTSSS